MKAYNMLRGRLAMVAGGTYVNLAFGTYIKPCHMLLRRLSNGIQTS